MSRSVRFKPWQQPAIYCQTEDCPPEHRKSSSLLGITGPAAFASRALRRKYRPGEEITLRTSDLSEFIRNASNRFLGPSPTIELIAGVWLIDNARDLQTLFRNFDGEVMDGGEFEKRLMDMFSEFLDERGPNLTIIGARDISSERPSAVLGYQRGLDADENGITYLIEPLFAFGQITARSWQAAQACFEMHIASDFECLAKTMAATGEFRMINPYLPMPHVVLHDLTEGLIYSVESARTRIFDAEIFTAADAMRVAPAMYLQPEDISDNLLERLGSGCRIVRDAATSTWCIISYLEDKLAENFDNPDDAKRALIWLAGAHLPSEWEVIAADPAGLILEIRIPRSKPATVYAEECRMHFPGQQFYEAKPLSPQFVN